MLSANQMSAVDKLNLMWASIHDETSPTHDFFTSPTGSSERVSRSVTKGDVKQSARTSTGQGNLPYTAIKLWNMCDNEIRSTGHLAPKLAIKTFAKTLPI